jgi:hypothetical protein
MLMLHIELPAVLLRAAAAFLQEGSLDSRTYGKRLLWAVKVALRGSRPDMERLLSGGCSCCVLQ